MIIDPSPMSSAVLLLLTVVSLLLGATSASAGHFDYELCKERLCLVNKGCSTFDKSKLLEPYTGEERCKILLAIWPYSDTKWRVTIQTRFVPTSSISVQLNDTSTKKITNIVSCTQSGGVFTLNVSPSRSAVLIDGTLEDALFKCEFFLYTTSNTMLPIGERLDDLELKYGNNANEYSLRYLSHIKGDLHDYEGICDPDRIKFDQSAAKPGQRLAPVNTDQFHLTCPEDYDLMYYDGSVPRKVSTIKCTATGKFVFGVMQYNYMITRPYGVGKVTVISRDRDFYAFCAAPCASCSAY